MPPKLKVTKEKIVEAALVIVREGGAEALNARAIAAALGCSTQPVFSNFSGMEDLQGAVVKAAYARYFEFIQREIIGGRYPEYKAFGMAYIRFAKEESELFQLLFMCDRRGKDLTPTEDFDASVEMIMQANNVTRETATRMHLEMWSCVHGIATMMATSFLVLDWDLISEMLSDVYHGIRMRLATEEKKNACN
jgi:AcrR family transcriptional regulator